jgi:hypothetical protein
VEMAMGKKKRKKKKKVFDFLNSFSSALLRRAPAARALEPVVFPEPRAPLRARQLLVDVGDGQLIAAVQRPPRADPGLGAAGKRNIAGRIARVIERRDKGEVQPQGELAGEPGGPVAALWEG